jgi:hypothetical protein
MKLGHALSLGVLLSATMAVGQGIGPITTQVPNANQRVGHPATKIASGFQTKILAKGSDPLENPSGLITNFGLLSDGTLTEPDQNTYLVFSSNPGGPTSGFDYGRHFVFQGHENGGDLGYVTRVNLDVTDPAHRITLLTPVGSDGLTHFNSTDGSTLHQHSSLYRGKWIRRRSLPGHCFLARRGDHLVRNPRTRWLRRHSP